VENKRSPLKLDRPCLSCGCGIVSEEQLFSVLCTVPLALLLCSDVLFVCCSADAQISVREKLSQQKLETDNVTRNGKKKMKKKLIRNIFHSQNGSNNPPATETHGEPAPST